MTRTHRTHCVFPLHARTLSRHASDGFYGFYPQLSALSPQIFL